MHIVTKPTHLLAFIIVGFISGTGVSESRTLYVERWGQNTLDCGSKSSPCELISHALLQRAKRNDRIVVGPGTYLDNISVDLNNEGEPLSGVKIESVGGRNVTIIDAVQNDLPVFDIRQPNVRLGKKGKGFSVTGATSSSGIEFADTVADRGRVEGNLSYGNVTGFSLTGDKMQVRYNIARENGGDGFECHGCTSARIQDNQALFNGGDGFNVSGSGKIVFQKNRSVRNDLFGYRVQSGGGGEASGLAEKYLHNLAFDNAFGGFRMDRPEKVTFTGNIATLNGLDGHQIRNNTGMSTNAPSIRNNVSVSNGSSGLEISSNSELAVLDNVKLEGNHAVDNQHGIRITSGVQFSVSKSNNTYNNVSGCGIRNEEEVDVIFLKHFMSTAGTPNDVCNEGSGMAEAQLVDKPSSVRLTAAKQL